MDGLSPCAHNQRMNTSQMISDYAEHCQIRSLGDLSAYWSAAAPEGRAGRSLHVRLVRRDGTVLPVQPCIADIPAVPPPQVLSTLVQGIADVLEAERQSGTAAAFLVVRPGAARLLTTDHLWASGLLHEADRVGMTTWPTHVATDEGVLLVDDDLLVA